MQWWWGKRIRSKAATFLKWCLIRSSQQKFYAHFWARLPIIEAWIRVQIEWLPLGQGGLRMLEHLQSATLWEHAFINIHLLLACAVKSGQEYLNVLRVRLSLQELAFITIHPMLACAVKQLIKWNQYCSIVDCREPLNHVAAQHWTSAQELYIILCCFLIFSYLSNTFFPCSSSMVGWIS
jgi:hypothetical protein